MRALLREGSRLDDPHGSCYGLRHGQTKHNSAVLHGNTPAGMQGDSPWKVGDRRCDKDQALNHHRRQGNKKSPAKYHAEYREWKRRIFTLLFRMSWPGWTEHRSAVRGSHVTPGAYAELEPSPVLYGRTTQVDHRQWHL